MASSKSSKKGKSKSAAKKAAAKKAAAKKQTSQRWIGVVVCFVLLLLSVLSLFNGDGYLIGLWTLLIKGLFGGTGVYILPLSLSIIFFVLLFRRGRPYKAKLICAIMMVLCIGAIAHIMGVNELQSGEGLISALWKGGIEGTTGGVICGLIGIGIGKFFGKFIAVSCFIILLFICILTTLNMSPRKIFRALQNRPKLEPEEEEEEKPDPASVIVNHVAQRRIDRIQHKRDAQKQIADFDIPVDDAAASSPQPSTPQPKKAAKRAISPDELIAQRRAETQELQAQPEQLQITEQTDEAQPTQVLPIAAEAVKEETVIPSPATKAMVQEFVENMPQKVKPEEAKASAIEIAQQISEKEESAAPQYVFPPLDLLSPPSASALDGTAEMKENAKRLDETLKSFNIDAHIVNVTRGPSITRYELELDRGVKLSKITGLADDIALSLGASGVRISAIPDKISVVGIEVPNKLVSTVYAREVIGSGVFHRAKSRLSFAVGKDIGGMSIVGDIGKLPHLLIAGTTGSGKSVCMNSLIISLLFKASPEEVKLIMIDPKMVELGIYNGIPHLLIPVVTDPKKAAGSLQWAVTEMMRRYRMMADAGVRNLEEYNKLAAVSDEYDAMPQIVVVIDELADLMLVAAKDVEEAICRVAQMGRASGIHLIVATQRPSADVITGLMKANIPSRIAFAVASAIESRIILDTIGAEKLVGKGDMLYAPLGEGKPKRVQGCFITDEEVQRVVAFIKSQQLAVSEQEQQKILDQITQKADGREPEHEDGIAVQQEGDELLPAAVEVVLESGQASVSMLQRRLKLGYARAARIVDEMEDKGIVGPFEGSKPRQLLISREQWQAMQNGEQLEIQEPVPDEIP